MGSRNDSAFKFSTLLFGVAVIVATVVPVGPAAADARVGLGTASSFAVLAGAGVTNTGPSVISGDLGTCPTPAITGFLPGVVVGGTTHANDAVACAAKSDLVTAYNDAAGRAPTTTYSGSTELGGRTLVAGTYKTPTSFAITGTLALDAENDPNAVFVFQAGSTLITATSSNVALRNGAQACNVFWKVGSSATLGVGSNFVGSILALSSITANTGARVQGRLLARNGATTLDSNRVSRPGCVTVPPTTSTVPTTTTTTTPEPTTPTTLAETPTTAVTPTTSVATVTPTTSVATVTPTTSVSLTPTTVAVAPTPTTVAPSAAPTPTTTAPTPTTAAPTPAAAPITEAPAAAPITEAPAAAPITEAPAAAPITETPQAAVLSAPALPAPALPAPALPTRSVPIPKAQSTYVAFPATTPAPSPNQPQITKTGAPPFGDFTGELPRTGISLVWQSVGAALLLLAGYGMRRSTRQQRIAS